MNFGYHSTTQSTVLYNETILHAKLSSTSECPKYLPQCKNLIILLFQLAALLKIIREIKFLGTM